MIFRKMHAFGCHGKHYFPENDFRLTTNFPFDHRNPFLPSFSLQFTSGKEREREREREREKRAQIREREGRSRRRAARCTIAIVDRAARSTSALVSRRSASAIDERARLSSIDDRDRRARLTIAIDKRARRTRAARRSTIAPTSPPLAVAFTA